MQEYERVKITITEEMIADYVYKSLINRGYAPTSDEILDLAEIFIDFLFEHSEHVEEA